jgi:hypothetical protein
MKFKLLCVDNKATMQLHTDIRTMFPQHYNMKWVFANEKRLVSEGTIL